MSKSPVFRCTCCNSEMSPKRKKPVTTWSGEMDSVYSECVKDFPKGEWEDLCPRCLKEIRNYNADLTKGMENLETVATAENIFPQFCPPVRMIQSDKMEEECSELRMDVEFRYVNTVYQGYSDD